MANRPWEDGRPLDQSIGKHSVFISHRGIEMKRKFANHLYYSLKKHGIEAFLDMEELPERDDVRPFMLEAARRAIIQVPIFNNTYAESAWCLDELVEMIQSTKSPNNAKVIPVFYGVKSEDLRNMNMDGEFGKAINGHREKGKRDEHTIQGWVNALKEASWLEGYRLETYNRCEGELCNALVEKIVHEIEGRTLLPLERNAVGLEGRVNYDMVNPQ